MVHNTNKTSAIRSSDVHPHVSSAPKSSGTTTSVATRTNRAAENHEERDLPFTTSCFIGTRLTLQRGADQKVRLRPLARHGLLLEIRGFQNDIVHPKAPCDIHREGSAAYSEDRKVHQTRRRSGREPELHSVPRSRSGSAFTESGQAAWALEVNHTQERTTIGSDAL